MGSWVWRGGALARGVMCWEEAKVQLPGGVSGPDWDSTLVGGVWNSELIGGR